jgi:hypothetical protein
MSKRMSLILKGLSILGILFLSLIALYNVISGVAFLFNISDSFSLGFLLGNITVGALSVWGIIALGRYIKKKD